MDFNTIEIGAALTGAAFPVTAVQKALLSRLDGDADKPVTFNNGIIASEIATGLGMLCSTLSTGLSAGGFLLGNLLAVKNLEEAMLNVLLHGVNNNYLSLLRHGHTEAPRIVRKAVDFIHAHAHLPISTGEIAAAAGINVRSLQLAFKKWREVTPHGYLRHVRLKKARAELLTPEAGAVGEIARKWGFLSSGEFSRLYWKTFGERPMETRRRAR